MTNNKEPLQEFEFMLKDAIHKVIDNISIDTDLIHYSISMNTGIEFDISSSIALRLSKQAKRSPNELAEEIVKHINNSIYFSSITATNGYINVVLSHVYFSEYILNQISMQKERYGSSEIGNRKLVLIEYPSVNPNKPWHVGHLRNPLIGDSISKIMEFCSYKILRLDYIEDLGLQMAEILWGKNHLEWEQKDKKFDQFLGERYVEINKHLKEEGVQEEINNILKKMEDTKSKESKQIREIASESVKAQYETAFRYGIYHDMLIWESDILNEKLMEKTILLLEKQGLIKKEDTGKLAGCIVIKTNNTDDKEQTSRVLLRSNGVPTYLAKDIALHMWKLGIIEIEFKQKNFIKQPNGNYVITTTNSGEKLQFNGANFAINIIGSAQNEPQAILKRTISIINQKKSDGLFHISYGEVNLKEGKISGRSGTWLGSDKNYTADDLFKIVKQKAREILLSSDKLSNTVDPEEISDKIALSAIKFDFLRADPTKKLIFDWDRALDFNSNSGPYCMYMYARSCKLLEKAKVTSSIKLTKKDFDYMERDYSFELIKLISNAKSIVEKSCREYKPNIIAEYVMELSILFGKFYEHVDVLNSGEAKQLRLAIVYATKQTLYNMLALLGITPLSSM